MTIQQYASFDAEAAGLNATSNTNPAVSKMVKLWESKNAQRALKGSGLTLMAMSLTACGGSDDVAVVTPVTPTVDAAESQALTINADTVTTGSGDDVIMAAYAGTTPAATLSVGDTVDGGAGTDTIKIIKTAAIAQTDVAPTGATVVNVEIAELTSGAAIVANTSVGALTGIETLVATSTGGATITAAATTDITLTDASVDTATDGEITVNGGKNVTLTLTADDAVTDGDANNEIVVGATTAAVGAVNVTHTGKHAAAADNTLSTIEVNGGTTITVTQNAGVTAAQQVTALAGTNGTTTLGAIDVNGDASTTAVTVNQTAALAENDTATTGQIGIANGAVTIDDANAASATAAGTITTATLNNFGAATINSGALTTLNLSGTGTSANAGTLGALTTAANTTLALNVDSLTTTGAVTIDTDITTLNLAATGTASTINALSAAGATTLNASGDAKVTLTGHTLTAVTAVNVTNTAGLDMDGTVLGNAVTFTGGAGADAISVGATTKANTMGAGNDTVVYGGAAGTGGSVDAGAGTDIISMTFAEANAADASATFNSTFTNFETLNVEDAITGALDIDGLNNASTVVLAAGSNGGTINNLDTGGTVHLKANNAGTLAINIDGAIAQSADVANIKLDKAGVLTGNTVTVANVETINIDGTDTSTNGAAAAINTMTLTAAAATSVVVTGNNGLNLTATSSAKIVDFDASAVVGNSTTARANVAATTDTAANLAVTYTSLNATANAAVSIKGGAGNDTLSGSAAALNVDTISGGAGDDVIQGGSGADVLDGGTNSTTGGDTVTYADVTGATSHGLANLTGMAINLGATDVVQGTIASAMGGTVVIGGGAGVAGSALEAGTVGYLSSTAANSTATMVRDTVTGFEKVIGSSLADYIVGSAGADTITGGLGADYITGGAGADDYIFTSGLTIDTIVGFVSGSDDAVFSLSALEAAGAVIAGKTADIIDGDGTSLAAGATMVVLDVAAATVLTGTATVLNYTAATAANAAALETLLEAGGGLLTTEATTGVTAADSMLAMYDNGTNIMLAMVEFTATVAAGTQIAAVDVTDIASLSGVTTDLVAGDFALIA